MLTLEVQPSPHRTVLRCSGRIVQGDGADELLKTVMLQDSHHIQIDLSEVNAIDAGGLGALVAVARWAQEGNGSLMLVNPSGRVREMLETTRLTCVLRVSSEARGRGEAA